jgi:4-oxalocrotonate tautomerase
MDWSWRGKRPGKVPQRRRRRVLEETTMPVVTVQQLPKTAELKRELVARITDAFVDAYKIPADTVHVWIEESAAENYAVGGKLTADK